MSESASQSSIIEMRNVQVTALRDTSLVVLENVNWSVAPGEFWVIAGPQHSGKSDLLLHAAGLMTPAEGACRLFGCDTGELDETQIALRLRVGFAFADARLFNQLTIAENIALPMRYHGQQTETEMAQTLAALLELLELAPFADLTPGNAAGAWRQRAALARALALKPELLLLDDPGSGLTARHRQWLTGFLEQLREGHAAFGGRPMTIVIATDDLSTWQHPKRRFAAVHERAFSELGQWGGDDFVRHQAVKELLTGAAEPEKP